jgi:hypothetical protein
MTYINIFLENKEKNLLKDKLTERTITNIDDARSFCIDYLKKLHFDVKYKIEVELKNSINSINIIFEKDTCLNREYIINNLLNDK